ncbi:unnamed protein product, partial [Mesorhabditis belari]|uniref:Uncharacterized protein n=1 Tax=Mesorhabditis belari TaxID=2138241 RepID=A0AAF3FEC5_9BILA
MRKRINELDHLIQAQEREHKTIVSKRAELEHEFVDCTFILYKLKEETIQLKEKLAYFELQGQGSAKAIENGLEPHSKQTLSTRNRSSIGLMPVTRGSGQQDKYDKYGRLRELHERNVLARPHLKESYFIEAQSPTSYAVLRGKTPKQSK